MKLAKQLGLKSKAAAEATDPEDNLDEFLSGNDPSSITWSVKQSAGSFNELRLCTPAWVRYQILHSMQPSLISHMSS